ncbi:MAG: hypothetical protein JNK61_00325 [Bacteroidia bacterium]|nr:hypothetical protein [Bacteroidia bacterium]HQV00267.1 hypothetical protein [Bacteroidia bacterium]
MITEFEVMQAEDFFKQLEPAATQQYFEDFAKNQVNPFVYLMTLSEDLSTDLIRHETLFLCGVIYQSFVIKYKQLQTATKTDLDDAQQQAITQIQAEALKQQNSDAADQTIFQKNRQSFLLAYVMHEVARGRGVYTENDRLILFTILHTLILCFDKQVASA